MKPVLLCLSQLPSMGIYCTCWTLLHMLHAFGCGMLAVLKQPE